MEKYYITHISNPRKQQSHKDGKPSLEYVVICLSKDPNYDATHDILLDLKHKKKEHLSPWGIAKTTKGFVQCFQAGHNVRMRIISQYYDSNGAPTWGSADTANGFIARCKETPFVEGELITRDVVPYSINYSDKIYSTYSLIVFSHENIETVFRQAGHPIVQRHEGANLKKG